MGGRDAFIADHVAVRIAASLKERITPANVVVQRLTNAGPADRVAKALTALGRLAKTVHILRYLHEEPLRRLVQLQLNRGEFRHTLAKWLFFANQGAFRTGDYEEIMNKASCLSLGRTKIRGRLRLRQHIQCWADHRWRGRGTNARRRPTIPDTS